MRAPADHLAFPTLQGELILASSAAAAGLTNHSGEVVGTPDELSKASGALAA